MNISNVIFIYAIIIAIGGIYGYVTIKSKHSIISGLVTGIVLYLCSYFYNLSYQIPFWISSLGAVYLTYTFYKRYSITKKVIPSLLLTLISLLVSILLFYLKFKGKINS